MSNKHKIPLTKELSDEMENMKYGNEEAIPGEKVKTIVKKINKNTNQNLQNAAPSKPRKTIEEQKIITQERERKALEDCWRSNPEFDKSQTDLDSITKIESNDNLPIQDQDIKRERQPKFSPRNKILPQIDEKKITFRSHDHPSRRNIQNDQSNELPKCLAKCQPCCKLQLKEQKSCHINLKNSKLKVFTPRRNQVSVMEMTLGKPYGVQLGALSVSSEFFSKEVRNRQNVDAILVAHGMTYVKPPFRWTQHDIDNILMVGTELHKETRDVNLDKLREFTKGFTYKKHFIQVTMSEPILVGKVMTLAERSMDLLMGLERFFSQHKQGILQTSNLDLYIVKRQAFIVFDPRGRTVDCIRDSQGEAALMVLQRLENVYHLILNLSKVNSKGSFKISTLTVTQLIDSKYSLDKFTADSGNPNRRCRSDDYENLETNIAYLRGTLHLYSKVFCGYCGKQSLTTAIMAMVYAKLDPPNSWATTIVDRVFHFGAKLYSDCLQGGPIRNLTLLDIPSKFYVGDTYRAGIIIAPFLKRITPAIKPMRLFCDDPVTPAVRCLMETSPFHCLLLQIDNSCFAIWKMKSTDAFYLFDPQQKDVDGNVDLSEGTSYLFLLGTIDRVCELIVKRISKLPKSSKGTVNIHGLKINELTRLTEKEQKCKPRFKVAKMDCLKPVTADDVEMLEESPSTVDSIAPMLTAEEIKTLRENPPGKLKSAMSSAEETLSMIQRKEFPRETFEVVRCIHSDILLNIFECDLIDDSEHDESCE